MADLQVGKKSSEILNRCKDLLFSVFAYPVGTVRIKGNPLLQTNHLCKTTVGHNDDDDYDDDDVDADAEVEADYDDEDEDVDVVRHVLIWVFFSAFL